MFATNGISIVTVGHEITRLGIRYFANLRPAIEIVDESSEYQDALNKILVRRPSVVVTEIHIKGGSGIALCREVKRESPGTAFVFLASVPRKEELFAAIEAGASAYLLKGAITSQDLEKAISAVGIGQSMIDPSMTATLLEYIRASQILIGDEGNILSTQEIRVLTMLADGKKNRDIAAGLSISEGTVKNYVSSILDKLNLANRAEAAAWLVRHQPAKN
jgi:DNA-binding NarL/FixJ family response regulator